MAVNILQQVQTYQLSNLAILQNYSCFISSANTKFKDFEKLTANLGDTVTFDAMPRLLANPGLVVNFEGAQQRVHSLTVDKSYNVPIAFTAQEFIFNVEDYLDKFGDSASAELGAVIEADVATCAVKYPYRFYGNGTNTINSYTQLATAVAYFGNYGMAKDKLRGFISDIDVPSIVGTGLNQFAPSRNDEAANSWDLGNFSGCDWYKSNLLPVHIAGTVGQDAQTLTVVSINAAGDQITFSGADNDDPDAFKENDLIQFLDNVVGFDTNLRYLTWTGHKVSANPVQVRVTADAESNGSGNVTVNIYPALIYDPTDPNKNLNVPITAGRTVKAVPSHRAGLIYSGDALFLAMPKLPDCRPFDTGNAIDPDTGVSCRLYYGNQFGMNSMGLVHDAIYGYTLKQEYGMRVILPLSATTNTL